MNLGTENRKKTITAASLGMVAVICLGYLLYTVFGGDSAPTPPPTVAPISKPVDPTETAAPTTAASTGTTAKTVVMPTGNAAGVPAKSVAKSSASLDPTLNQTSMLRTEHLVYSGSGRNIFSATYVPEVKIQAPVAPPRKTVVVPPPAPYVPPPPLTCPPSCPPINLKFFGVETLKNGKRQAFLLQGDDVFLAAEGDIVARRYRIVSVSQNSMQVEDMANKNTQTLPLQSN